MFCLSVLKLDSIDWENFYIWVTFNKHCTSILAGVQIVLNGTVATIACLKNCGSWGSIFFLFFCWMVAFIFPCNHIILAHIYFWITIPRAEIHPCNLTFFGNRVLKKCNNISITTLCWPFCKNRLRRKIVPNLWLDCREHLPAKSYCLATNFEGLLEKCRRQEQFEPLHNKKWIMAWSQCLSKWAVRCAP